MNQLALNGLVIIEGRATYERIVSSIRGMESEEAIRQIQNFLKIYPEFAQAHNDIAVLYYQSGNGLKALAHYEKSHKLEPSNITYRKNLADFYFVELEWADDAIQTYLDILKDNPFDVETLNALGTINAQTGRREQARQYFNRTLQLDSMNSLARQALQQLDNGSPASPQSLQLSTPAPDTSSTIGIRESSAAHSSPAIQRSVDEIYAEVQQLAQQDRLSEAHSLMEELAHNCSDNALFQNDLGVLRYQSGDIDGARNAYEHAVRLQPANSNFRKNLADLYFAELGMLDDAIRVYLDLFEENPRDFETLAGLGKISAAVGHSEEAKSFYRRALEIEPWNIEIRGAFQDLF